MLFSLHINDKAGQENTRLSTGIQAGYTVYLKSTNWIEDKEIKASYDDQ